LVGGVDLPKYKRNDLFEAIQKGGMDPEEFDISVGANEATLRNLPSGASFVLSGDVTGYAVRRVAGDGPVEERTGLSWYRVEEEQIGLWLSDVKWHVNMPIYGLSFSVSESCSQPFPMRRSRTRRSRTPNDNRLRSSFKN
jgi:hypothetical protein